MKAKDEMRDDKSGMTQEVKDQLTRDWWKQIAKVAEQENSV